MIFLITAITALIWHLVLARLWLASLGSALTATLIALLLTMLLSQSGFESDGLYIETIAIIKIFAVSLVFSVVVGYGVKLVKSRMAKQKI